jgi:hypothetical protein
MSLRLAFFISRYVQALGVPLRVPNSAGYIERVLSLSSESSAKKDANNVGYLSALERWARWAVIFDLYLSHLAAVGFGFELD